MRSVISYRRRFDIIGAVLPVPQRSCIRMLGPQDANYSGQRQGAGLFSFRRSTSWRPGRASPRGGHGRAMTRARWNPPACRSCSRPPSPGRPPNCSRGCRAGTGTRCDWPAGPRVTWPPSRSSGPRHASDHPGPASGRGCFPQHVPPGAAYRAQPAPRPPRHAAGSKTSTGGYRRRTAARRPGLAGRCYSAGHSRSGAADPLRHFQPANRRSRTRRSAR